MSIGSAVGTPIVIQGYDSLLQGGIAVDNCNNIYLGGRGVIKTFAFDGSNFTAGQDIALDTGFSRDAIYDVRYNANNNELYIAGSHVVGIIQASLSTTCKANNMLEILPSDPFILKGDSIQLNSSLNGYQPSNTSYNWTPSTGLNCVNCPNPIFSSSLSANDTVNVFTLTLKYNGCSVMASDTVRIEPLALTVIPTAFTPNGDGKNDNFFILAKGARDFNMSIYNRWGQEVFTSSDINFGWDGNYKGKSQPQGEYTFYLTVRYQYGKTESHCGTLTLFR